MLESHPSISAWIQSQVEKQTTEAERERRKQAEAALSRQLLQIDGPKFWAKMVEALEESKGLEALEIEAVLSVVANHGGEGRALTLQRIQALSRSRTTVWLFYDGPGADSIRCLVHGGNEFKLRFCFSDESQIRVVAPRNPDRMTADAAALYIVQVAVGGLE